MLPAMSLEGAVLGLPTTPRKKGLSAADAWAASSLAWLRAGVPPPRLLPLVDFGMPSVL